MNESLKVAPHHTAAKASIAVGAKIAGNVIFIAAILSSVDFVKQKRKAERKPQSSMGIN